MKIASTISVGLHLAVLLFALLSFSGRTLEATPPESLPVDLVSEKDFSQLTKGVKTAPQLETPKPLIEKKGDPKPAEDPTPKVTEKKEIKPTAEKAPEQPPETKPDPIADKIKKMDEPKKEAKADTKPLPPKKPEKKQPKFDADKIAALLDKRDPQREAATGAELNAKPSLGAAKGDAAQLSQSEIDGLKARLRQCWNPPVGASDAANIHVVFRVLFKRDGSLQTEPTLVEASASQFGPALAESAKRALLQCQPFKMLKVEHYDNWRDIEINFDPREMFGG